MKDPPLAFDSIEDSIEAFKDGNFIVVLDSQDRENEGDLIVAAEGITTEQMAFMIRHTSGLVCTPITQVQTEALDLPQMVAHNKDPHLTAYTQSVDASSVLVTTGISAHDRALTCRTLAHASATPEAFRRPGHVFPLLARNGGIKQRQGHTEAAIEFCRLAGKRPVSVISELVEDGEEISGKAIRGAPGMLRRDGCLEFGRKWGLKVCTIEDLVAYVKKGGTPNGIMCD